MNKIILMILLLALAFSSVLAQKKATAERKVEFQSYANARYFERNDSNLKGDSSYLAFNTLEEFEQIFGYATIMGDNHFMPENVFDSKLVIAMIKRGESKYIYNLKKVTLKNKKLYVWYDLALKDPETAKMKARADGSYTYISRCFLTVDKNNYSEIFFMENGKKAGTISLNKDKAEIAPESVIRNLYAAQRNPKTAPFFQTKSRAAVDRYFDADFIGDMIWKDAVDVAHGKAAAINFHPLFSSQAQTTAFTISRDKNLGDSTNAWVNVKFKNAGKAEEVNFEMQSDDANNWKIRNIYYTDREDLATLLRYSKDTEFRTEYDKNTYFKGDFWVGTVKCAFTPIGPLKYRVKCADRADYQIYTQGDEGLINSVEINDKWVTQGEFIVNENSNEIIFKDAAGKEVKVSRIKKK